MAAVDEMRRTGARARRERRLARALVAVPGGGVRGTSTPSWASASSTQADLHQAGQKASHGCAARRDVTPMLYDSSTTRGLACARPAAEPEEVAAMIGRGLDRPRQVTAVPAWRGLETRLADAVPDLSLKALSLFVAQGRRTQRKLRARRRQAPGEAPRQR